MNAFNNNGTHSIYIPNGYSILTMPATRLANAILFHLGQDHHGMPACGGGRLGKTTAIHYLAERAMDWLGPDGIAVRMNMPQTERRSDGAFFEAVSSGLKLAEPGRASARGRRLQRVVNFLLQRCGAAHAHKVVFFIDNAHRITSTELDYLVDLDDATEENGIRLFVVFVMQSDVTGIELKEGMLSYPSHITGRFLMGRHEFTGLLGFVDIEHALGRYDHAAFWPDEKTSFSAYFAGNAFRNGWRLKQHAQLIVDTMKLVRNKHKLVASDEFPMLTFTGMVKYLLCDVAANDPAFEAFEEKHVLAALEACGYVRLELVRLGRIRDWDQGQQEAA